LFAADADGTESMVAGALAELGATPEIIACYLALLGAAPARKEEPLEFFAEFMRHRKALE
jgi:hypothetical protein